MSESENDYHPSNDLERALVNARAGRLATTDFIRVMLSSEVHILSGQDPGEDFTQFAPLVYRRPESGEPMIALYSSPARIGPDAKTAPFMMTMTCGQFLERLPEGLGVVLNPGDEVGFELLPPALAAIVARIKQRGQN